MTKKRRNLRILASIIAAGCVWATGMGNAWAADSAIKQAVELNYIAIGGITNGASPFEADDMKGAAAQKGEIIDIDTRTDNKLVVYVNKTGADFAGYTDDSFSVLDNNNDVTKIVYNLKTATYQVLYDENRLMYTGEYNSSSGLFAKDNSGNYYQITEEVYNVGSGTPILARDSNGIKITDYRGRDVYKYTDGSGQEINLSYDGSYYYKVNETLINNATSITNIDKYTSTNTYWVRSGYAVKPITARYHPSAKDLRLDLVRRTSEEAHVDYIARSGEHSAAITNVRTAINKVALDEITYIQYAALTNSTTTDTAPTNNFFIKRGEEYINVGNISDVAGRENQLFKNFYAFTANDIDDNTGNYKFNDEIVDYAHVYNIDGVDGVFLTGEHDSNLYTKTETNNGGNITVTIDQHISSKDLAALGISVYEGTVFGKNNEVLLSGFDEKSNKWHTVWAAEITDPTATISSMTIGDFNNILHHLHEEDVKLAMADIEYTKVESVAGGGKISLMNKENVAVPGSLTITGGGGNSTEGDTFVTIAGAGGWVYDAEKKEWVADNTVSANSFRLNTGSKVVGNGGPNVYVSGQINYLDTLTINEQVYKLDKITGFTIEQETNGTGEKTGNLVATITTSSGSYSNTIRIGDFVINYNGTVTPPGTTNPSNPTYPTSNETTIENTINNNYNYIQEVDEEVQKGWDVSVNGNVNGKVNVKMGERVDFKSSDNNLIFALSDNNGVANIDVQLNKNLTGLTSITLGDNSSNVVINSTSINMNGGDITNVNNITTKHITLGDTNNTTEINYQTTNEYGNRITYQEGNTTQYVANLNDGLTFAGDSGSAEVDLNKQVKIYGGATEYATGRNIGVVASSDNENGANLEVKLAKNLTGIDTIQVNNSITVGDIQINKDGRITNVTEAVINENSTDVVVGKQLYQVQQEINAGNAQLSNRLDRLGNRVDKVGAGAAALAALHPMDFDPDDKLQFSAGVGNYRGETAAALGAFYRPTEKVMFSVAGTMGNDDNMVSAGVTFALDRKNNVSNSRVAMAHEIKDLREQVAALTALVSQIAGKGNPLLDTVMFPDVPENHWAYDYVESLQKRGIIEGYPDGNFAGDRSMTRYEYAAMLYRALEKGFPVDGRLLKEFEAELGRIRIDRIKGADDDANKVERVRVNDYEGRDDYGSKLAQVVADAAPVVEEEPAA